MKKLYSMITLLLAVLLLVGCAGGQTGAADPGTSTVAGEEALPQVTAEDAQEPAPAVTLPPYEDTFALPPVPDVDISQLVEIRHYTEGGNELAQPSENAWELVEKALNAVLEKEINTHYTRYDSSVYGDYEVMTAAGQAVDLVGG